MIRLLLTPKWLGLTAIALLAVVAMGWLSSWQYGRVQDTLAAERAALALPVPLDEVLPAIGPLDDSSVGRPVVVEGTFVPGVTVLVDNRAVAGRPGLWALGVLRLDDGTGVLVVRGWVPTSTDPAIEVPATTVRIEGDVQAPERYFAGDSAAVDGRLVQVDPSVVAARTGMTLRSGFIVQRRVTPPDSPALVPVPTPIAAGTSVSPPLQNLFYAAQWLVFAGFVVLLWGRALRDDLRDRSDVDRDPATTG